MKKRNYILALIPVLMFLLFFTFFAVAFPKTDDIIINNFLVHLFDFHGLAKWSYWFEQYNGHRILTTKALFYLSEVVFGTVKYRLIMLLGLFSLLTVPYALFRIKHTTHDKPLLILIASVLLFFPAHYENQLWAMASVQNFVVVAAMVLSIYFLVTDKWITAICLGLFAIGTSMPALILLVSGAILLLLLRNFKVLGIWVLLFGATAGLYMMFHEKPEIGQSSQDIVQKFTLLATYTNFLKLPSMMINDEGKLLGIFFIVMGTAFYLLYAIMGLRVLFVKQKNNAANLFFFGISTTAFGVMLLTLFTRDSMNLSRYMVYPALFDLGILGYFVSKLKLNKLLLQATLLVWLAFGYFHYLPDYYNTKMANIATAVEFKLNDNFRFYGEVKTRDLPLNDGVVNERSVHWTKGLNGFYFDHLLIFNTFYEASLQKELHQYPAYVNEIAKAIERMPIEAPRTSKVPFSYPVLKLPAHKGQMNVFEDIGLYTFIGKNNRQIEAMNITKNTLLAFLSSRNYVNTYAEQSMHVGRLSADTYQSGVLMANKTGELKNQYRLFDFTLLIDQNTKESIQP